MHVSRVDVCRLQAFLDFDGMASVSSVQPALGWLVLKKGCLVLLGRDVANSAK